MYFFFTVSGKIAVREIEYNENHFEISHVRILNLQFDKQFFFFFYS